MFFCNVFPPLISFCDLWVCSRIKRVIASAGSRSRCQGNSSSSAEWCDPHCRPSPQVQWREGRGTGSRREAAVDKLCHTHSHTHTHISNGCWTNVTAIICFQWSRLKWETPYDFITLSVFEWQGHTDFCERWIPATWPQTRQRPIANNVFYFI